jgi:hypothetical protein
MVTVNYSCSVDWLVRKVWIDISRKIWNDPVGSKILGSLGYSALSAVGGCLLWPLVEKNWVAYLIVSALVVVEILLVWSIRPLSLCLFDSVSQNLNRDRVDYVVHRHGNDAVLAGSEARKRKRQKQSE